MKILVTGDRNWRDAVMIYTTLQEQASWLPLEERITLIQGDANGADVISNACAQLLDFDEIKSYPADWKQHKFAAGVIRNQQMLDENPDIDLVIAFHDDLANSKGTGDMVARAKKKGIPVKVVKH